MEDEIKYNQKPTKTNILKKQLIEALEKSLGVVTTACKKVGCNRSTFYEYFNDDELFRKQVNDIENIALDFAESQLYKKISEGDTTSIIFYLKTKAKKRGYVEKTEIENKTTIEFAGDPFQQIRKNAGLNDTDQ